MCFKSCIAYTRPFENLESCPECDWSQWNEENLTKSTGKKKVPERQFCTFSLANEMLYLHREIAEIQSKLDAGEDIQTYNDIMTGSELLNALSSGKIKDTDILFMQSLDGVQLYEDKKSDSWIIIYILFIASPALHYKKCFVLPGAIVSGPNNLENMDSFLFPGLHHISVLQKEKLRVWDALNKTYFDYNVSGCDHNDVSTEDI
ncbi:hypothetical protein M422DRAFT_59633 [Sphaerobolus stellatus SS14]|uniref:Uncharacterized protein n=1 Tax=Sphaerobolus stellatus (strain SS14) TaxID=990650 RepID=A0A0C9VU58_SPHS4|nr:hypothetical protein M422DRAFT_59633 [Sphaerobolus stellatus SS14]